MVKKELLTHWGGLPDNAPILPHFTPLAAPKGSTFGACGIRIDGNPAFVDAVLSRMKDLLVGENHITRLACSYNEAATGFKECPNAEPHAVVCYIRLHRRGYEGAIASGIFDKHLRGNMEAYQTAIGLDTETE